MKIAVVYDWATCKNGGAERLLRLIAEKYPQAELFTSVYNPQKANWANKFRKIRTSFLQNIPGPIKFWRFWGILMPLAFEQFNFDNYDLVLSLTSYPSKAIITKPQTKHFCYCFTPPRYLWERRFTNKLKFVLSTPFRVFDYFYAQRPDKFFTISQHAAKRIHKYYRRKTDIIYPGVCTSKFKPVKKTAKDNYFLIVSRLVPYKKVDIAIKAFNKLGDKLIIVGQGRQKEYLKSIAKKNIVFENQVSEEKLVSLYQNCQALIMPQEEDFGITALEAQSCGRPVIAYNKGGALETVVKDKTGLFFGKQNKQGLIRAVERFKTMKFNPKDCVSQAKKFSDQKFIDKIDSNINQ